MGCVLRDSLLQSWPVGARGLRRTNFFLLKVGYFQCSLCIVFLLALTLCVIKKFALLSLGTHTRVHVLMWLHSYEANISFNLLNTLQTGILHCAPSSAYPGDCPSIKPADPKDQGRSPQPGGQRGNGADQQTLPQHTGASPPAERIPGVWGPRLWGPGPLKQSQVGRMWSPSIDFHYIMNIRLHTQMPSCRPGIKINVKKS